MTQLGLPSLALGKIFGCLSEELMRETTQIKTQAYDPRHLATPIELANTEV